MLSAMPILESWLPVEIHGVKIRVVPSQTFTRNDCSSTSIRRFLTENDAFYDGEIKLAARLPIDKIMAKYIRQRNLYRKATIIDTCEELERHAYTISEAYGI